MADDTETLAYRLYRARTPAEGRGYQHYPAETLVEMAEVLQINIEDRLMLALRALADNPRPPKCLQRDPYAEVSFWDDVSPGSLAYSTPPTPLSRASPTDKDSTGTRPSTAPTSISSQPSWNTILGKRKRSSFDEADTPDPGGDAKRVCYIPEGVVRRPSAPSQQALSFGKQDLYQMYEPAFETTEQAFAQHDEPARYGIQKKNWPHSRASTLASHYLPIIPPRDCALRVAVGD